MYDTFLSSLFSYQYSIPLLLVVGFIFGFVVRDFEFFCDEIIFFFRNKRMRNK